MKVRKVTVFLRKNYIAGLFIASIALVVLVLISKSLFSKPAYIYAKIKVGQGSWWASTLKPGQWYVDSIRVGDVEYDLAGNVKAKILEKKYYRCYTSDQYDIYLTVLLKTSVNKRTGLYTYDRGVLSVGSPLEIQLPKTDVTGTVIALESMPFNDNLQERTITIHKRNAYAWEYDAIKVGDVYFDGVQNILEVIDKSSEDTSSFATENYGKDVNPVLESRKNITVKLKVKVRIDNKQLILGEDQVLNTGKIMSLSTSNFIFDNYFLTKVD